MDDGLCGWLPLWQPPAICPEQGNGPCQYRDIVFPTSWALYQWESWRRGALRELAGRTFSKEEKYMLWLGVEVTMYGIQASNVIKVTD